MLMYMLCTVKQSCKNHSMILLRMITKGKLDSRALVKGSILRMMFVIICCGYSLELPLGGDSNVYPQQIY